MILINPDFSKGIIAKYSVLVQRHRRFPVLTFLFIKPPPISFLQYLLLKTMTIPRPHRNYYLNQNLYFNLNYNLNPNLFSRIAEMSHIIIKNHLERIKTITGTPVNKEPGRVRSEFFGFLNTSVSTAHQSILVKEKKSNLTLNFYESKSSQYNKKEESFTEIGIAHSSKELKNSAKPGLDRSIAVFSPSSSITVTTPNLISRNFKDSLFFVQPVKLIPGNTKEKDSISVTHQDSNAFAGHLMKSFGSQDSSKFIPALNYSSPYKVALDSMKKTVTCIEKKIKEKEEKILLQKSYPDDPTVSTSHNHSRSGVSPGIVPDIDKLTDQVYRLLERKIMIEKERRGL